MPAIKDSDFPDKETLGKAKFIKEEKNTLIIGRFILTTNPKNTPLTALRETVWIDDDENESGTFSIKDFEKHIEEFFDKNF